MIIKDIDNIASYIKNKVFLDMMPDSNSFLLPSEYMFFTKDMSFMAEKSLNNYSLIIISKPELYVVNNDLSFKKLEIIHVNDEYDSYNFISINDINTNKHENHIYFYKKINKQILYIDLDGVVADYDAHKAITTEEERQLKGFFEDLPIIEGSYNAISKLSEKYDIYFLSTSPWSNIYASSEKRIWLEKHFGDLAFKKLILSHNKGLLKGAYLIDVYTKLMLILNLELAPIKSSYF
jgi:5'(3')-deoxyribonucleotidase